MTPALAAHAVPTTYFGEDLRYGEYEPLTTFPNASAAQSEFLSNLVNPGIENFGSRSGGAPLDISFTGAGTTATLQGSGSIESLEVGTTNGYGRYGISGDPDADGYERYWDAGSQFSISLDNPVAAFGFYGIDIGDFSGQVTAATAGGLDQVFDIPNSTNIAGGSVLFWGVIDPDNTFSSVTFGNTESGTDVFAFDNFTIGSPEQVRQPSTSVPEPGTLLLFGAGLAGLGMTRRRRRLGDG